MSLIALVEYVFTLPGVKVFLSERICQDPLEKFFGCQRQRGGTNENPNVKEFCQNTQALHIVNSFCKDIARGNCRGSKSSTLNIDKENLVLPKRQQVRAKK